MKFKVIVFLICLVVFVTCAQAAQVKEIVLQDNSVIYGNVVGLENGVYKIKTKDAGLLSISEDNIVSIGNRSAGKDVTNKNVEDLKFADTPTDSNAVKGGIEALKRAMQSSSSTMQSVSDLQNDPDFMAVLNDPAIMIAVNSGDINALTSNPKFLKLLNHSSVKRIGDKVE